MENVQEGAAHVTKAGVVWIAVLQILNRQFMLVLAFQETTQLCHHLVRVALTHATAMEIATCMQLVAIHPSLLANVSVVVIGRAQHATGAHA